MNNTYKRLFRVLAAIGGIMMGFNELPIDTVAWIQTSGGWIMIIGAALYSNSDPAFPGAKKNA